MIRYTEYRAHFVALRFLTFLHACQHMLAVVAQYESLLAHQTSIESAASITKIQTHLCH